MFYSPAYLRCLVHSALLSPRAFRPVKQLAALHSKYPLVGPTTRAILLSTYVKFYNLYDVRTCLSFSALFLCPLRFRRLQGAGWFHIDQGTACCAQEEEVRSRVREVFHKNRNYIDSEIQQRAAEYAQMVDTVGDDAMVLVVPAGCVCSGCLRAPHVVTTVIHGGLCSCWILNASLLPPGCDFRANARIRGRAVLGDADSAQTQGRNGG